MTVRGALNLLTTVKYRAKRHVDCNVYQYRSILQEMGHVAPHGLLLLAKPVVNNVVDAVHPWPLDAHAVHVVESVPELLLLRGRQSRQRTCRVPHAIGLNESHGVQQCADVGGPCPS